MRSKYLDLQTGEVINAKHLLTLEKGKDRIWEAADELRRVLAEEANAKEEEANQLLVEAEVIRDYLKKYDAAKASLDIRTEYYTRHRT